MAVYAAAHAQVDGLVLEAPPASCPEVIRSWNPQLPWYLRWFVTLVPDPALADPAMQPIAMIADVRCPLLIIHGGCDTVIPQAQGRALFERAGATAKRFVALPRAGHNDVRIDREPVVGELREVMGKVGEE